MSELEPRRVPVGTSEITYTDADGAQRSIPVETLASDESYAYARPSSSGDATVLDAFGWTKVARKAMGEDEDPEPATEPTSASKRNTDTKGPGQPASAEEG